MDNFYKLGQMQMVVGFGIEVSEVPFDLFERRKVTRKNSAFNEDLKRIEVDLGYEVREVAFDEFERRKTPREN